MRGFFIEPPALIFHPTIKICFISFKGQMMTNMWDEKYLREGYLYGTEPNEFYKSELNLLQPGKILFLGEGEGRNALHAARLGWDVDAYDYSTEGQKKALNRAEEEKLKLNYTVQDLNDLSLNNEMYDVAVLVFLHLPEELRIKTHNNVINALKPGGKVIFEAFEKEQINNTTGGPKSTDLLYSLEEIFTDFQDFELKKFSKETPLLDEGPGHQGKAITVRLSAKKPAK